MVIVMLSDPFRGVGVQKEIGDRILLCRIGITINLPEQIWC